MERVSTSRTGSKSQCSFVAGLLVCIMVCSECGCGNCDVDVHAAIPDQSPMPSGGYTDTSPQSSIDDDLSVLMSAGSADRRSSSSTGSLAPCIGGGRYTQVHCQDGAGDDGRCPARAYFTDAAQSSQSVSSRPWPMSTHNSGVIDMKGRLLIAERNASVLADFIRVRRRGQRQSDSGRSSRAKLAASRRRCAAAAAAGEEGRCSIDHDVVPTVLVLFLSWSERSRYLAPLYSALSRSYPTVNFIAVDVVQLCTDDPHGCSALFSPGPGKICAFANDVVVFDATTLRTLGVYKTSSLTTLRSLTTFFADVTGLQPEVATAVLPYDDWLKPSSALVGTLPLPWLKVVMSVIALVSCAACLVYIGYVAFRPVSGFVVHAN